MSTLDPFLDEITGALCRDAEQRPSAPPPENPNAVRHGSERHRLGFDITTIVASYGALCDSITGIAAELGLTFSAREFQILNQWFDAGIAASLTAYWHQSKKQAERESALRVGYLAHELRNALSTATTAFAVIHEEDVAREARTAAILERSLGRMTDLVEHALTELRLRSSGPRERRRIAIAELLHDVEASMLSKHDVRLRLLVEDGLEIEGDTGLVTSAVANLVHNAVKFTRKGGVVQIRCWGSSGRLVIEVEDECGGLPAGSTDALFMPFVQSGRNRTGIGLGLSIAREATEANGGSLAVRDLPGKGCVFALQFPLYDARKREVRGGTRA